MSLNLNGNVTGIYLGSAKADAVYFGNIKVYDSGPSISYETILGKEYPVVTINGITVMAENLYYSDSNITTNSTNSETSSSTNRKAYRYNNASASASYKNGFYYGFKATQYVQSLLSGWHIITINELNNIYKYLNGGSLPSDNVAGDAVKRKIFSQSQWSTPGDNDYLLDLLPDGHGYASGYSAGMRWSNSAAIEGQYKNFVVGLYTTGSTIGFRKKSLYAIGSTARISEQFSTTLHVDVQSENSQSAYPLRLVKDA